MRVLKGVVLLLLVIIFTYTNCFNDTTNNKSNSAVKSKTQSIEQGKDLKISKTISEKEINRKFSKISISVEKRVEDILSSKYSSSYMFSYDSQKTGIDTNNNMETNLQEKSIKTKKDYLPGKEGKSIIRIYDEENISLNSCSRFATRLVFGKDASRETIRNSINKILNKKKDYCEYLVFAFREGEENGLAYMVGEWNKKKNSIQITVNDLSDFSSSKEKPEIIDVNRIRKLKKFQNRDYSPDNSEKDKNVTIKGKYWLDMDRVLHKVTCPLCNGFKKGMFTNDQNLGSLCPICFKDGVIEFLNLPEEEHKKTEKIEKYWLDESTSILHKEGCRLFGKSKNGKYVYTTKYGEKCGLCFGKSDEEKNNSSEKKYIEKEKYFSDGNTEYSYHKYWIDSKGIRHNKNCKFYSSNSYDDEEGNNNDGYYTGDKSIGKPCSICGG